MRKSKPKAESPRAFRHPSEEKAKEYLEGLGMTALAHNVHNGFAETDLVMRSENGVVRFVEVKAYSPGIVHPLERITEHRRRKMRRSALAWLSRQKENPETPVAFDLIWMKPSGEIEYFPDLF